ncbi:MAG: Sec-independent protein translocase protein TatB [Rhodanobacter sp.]
MIEISFAKLVVLALIALIVLGPEKLPVVARTAGALIRRVRGGWDTVRAEVERELEVEEIRRAARELVEQKDAVQAGLNATLNKVKDAAGAIAASSPVVKPASAPAPALAQDEDVPEPALDGSATEAAATDAGVGDLFANAEPSPGSAEAEASAAVEPPHGSN